jgi:purine-nucleoside phosphorylase
MNAEFFTSEEIAQAVAYVRSQTRHQPHVGLVLGSGLSGLADAVTDADRIPFSRIPHFPVSTVEGHDGALVIGRLQGQDVLVMQGRVHFYEGYSMQQVTLPMRVMQRLGIHTVILTNAAGGINPAFRAGELMLISDHINLIGMAGQNPLRGPNDPTFGPRFPSMTRVYDPQLRDLAVKTAARLHIPLQQGVYMCLAGPSFETPADIRFLRVIGADAVGMSTVPEAVVARHGGLRVLGISTISNVAIDNIESKAETTHQEVLETGKLVVPRLTALLQEILSALPAPAEPVGT